MCVYALCPLYAATFTLSVAPFCLQGMTLAHIASDHGHLEVFEYLVSRRPEQCTAKTVSKWVVVARCLCCLPHAPRPCARTVLHKCVCVCV